MREHALLYYSYHDCIKTRKTGYPAWTQRTLTTRTITYSSFTHVYSLLYTRHLSSLIYFCGTSHHSRDPAILPLTPPLPPRLATIFPSSAISHSRAPRGFFAAELRDGVVSMTMLVGELQANPVLTMAPTDRLEAGGWTRYDTRPQTMA